MKRVIKISTITAFCISGLFANAQNSQELNAKIKQLQEQVKEQAQSIDELYDRADENEFQATMNHIKWGGELEVGDSFISGKNSGVKYHSSNKWTTHVKLNMSSDINEHLEFHGRLSMFKNWGDSTTQNPTDPAQGRKPDGNSGLYVERAYVDYFPTKNIAFTVGRQPSSDGPGMTLIQNTQRKSTYPSLLFDGATDGVVASFKLAPKSKWNPTVRLAYGKGFQNQANYSPYTPTTNDIDDLNVYGAFFEMSVPLNAMGKNLFVLSYVHATDFVGHPQYFDAPNNQNLGDMDLAGIYFENTRAFNTGLNYFASVGFDMPKDNGKTVNFGLLTGNQNVTLLKDNGYAFHVGARYDIGSSVKVGYEFNHGSKYWYSFTSGSNDLLNKLATRGDVHDVYAIYQIDMNQFLRLGYTDIKYDYTGSGWHIGEPQKTDDYIKRGYLVYNVRF